MGGKRREIPTQKKEGERSVPEPKSQALKKEPKPRRRKGTELKTGKKIQADRSAGICKT